MHWGVKACEARLGASWRSLKLSGRLGHFDLNGIGSHWSRCFACGNWSALNPNPPKFSDGVVFERYGHGTNLCVLPGVESP